MRRGPTAFALRRYKQLVGPDEETDDVPLIKPFQGVAPAEGVEVDFPYYVKVQSDTDLDKVYNVVIYSGDGTANGCTCMHWQKRMTDCKHIKRVLAGLGISAGQD